MQINQTKINNLMTTTKSSTVERDHRALFRRIVSAAELAESIDTPAAKDAAAALAEIMLELTLGELGGFCR